MLSLLQSNRGIEKTDATNVPGRKTIVRMAKVFIDEESFIEWIDITLKSLANSRLSNVSV